MPAIPCKTRVEPSDRCVCDDLPLVNMSAADRDIPWEPNPPKPRPPMFDVPIGDPPTDNPPPSFCVQPPIPENCFPETPEPPEEPGPDPGDPPIPSDPLNPPQNPGDPNSPNPVDPGLPHPPLEYWNTESNCIAFCPDYSSSATAIIPAHMFRGNTQFEADYAASNACISLARSRLSCTEIDGGWINLNGCVDSPYSEQFFVLFAGNADVDIVGLPPGISWSMISESVGLISGTFTTCGSYLATVTISVPDGNTSVYHLGYNIMGITCPTAHGVKSNYYEAYATACGGTAPYTFSGTGAGGLIVAPDGKIFGIPTQCGDVGIDMTVTDDNGFHCHKTCTITVDQACTCPDWTNSSYVIDDNTNVRGVTTGFGTFTTYAENNSQLFDGNCPANPPSCPSYAHAGITGSLVVQAYGNCKCHMKVTWVGSWGTAFSEIIGRFKMGGGGALGNIYNATTHAAMTIDEIINSGAATQTYETDFEVHCAGSCTVGWLITSHAGPASYPGSAITVPGGSVRVTVEFTNVSTI